MTIEELIRRTYTDQGHFVESITIMPNGSYDVEFMGDYGIVKRNLAVLFLVTNDNQCQRQSAIPNN